MPPPASSSPFASRLCVVPSQRRVLPQELRRTTSLRVRSSMPQPANSGSLLVLSAATCRLHPSRLLIIRTSRPQPPTRKPTHIIHYFIQRTPWLSPTSPLLFHIVFNVLNLTFLWTLCFSFCTLALSLSCDYSSGE